MSYGWPLKPFDQQHPVRGFFCDPRIGDKGGKAFHFGVDVSAPDGTAVYAVEGGIVHSEGAQNVAVVGAGGDHSHGYWHIIPTVRHGQRVRKHALLGHIAKDVGTCPLRRAKGRPVREPVARRRTDAVQGLRRARGRPDRRRAGAVESSTRRR